MLVTKTTRYFQFVLLTLCILLAACSKLTQKNFDKIKVHMSMENVIAILGQPTSTEKLTIAGISGTSAVWKDKENEIDIQFLNDHVIVKSFSQDNEAQENEAEEPHQPVQK